MGESRVNLEFGKGHMTLSETAEHAALPRRDLGQCNEIYHLDTLCHWFGHASMPAALIPLAFHPDQALSWFAVIRRHDMCHPTLPRY
jgi:hypothetical protein